MESVDKKLLEEREGKDSQRTLSQKSTSGRSENRSAICRFTKHKAIGAN